MKRCSERGPNSKALLVRVFCLAVLVLIPAVPSFADVAEEPRSFSLAREAKRLEQVQLKTLSKVDVQLLLAEDEKSRKDSKHLGPVRFAIANDVAFTPQNSGTWQKVAGGRLWRLRIHSPGAVSHNLGITRYDMPRGAKLWIYDPDHTRVEGPYMARHRGPDGSLWTPIVPGDEIVVEVFVPAGVRKPVLEIRKANQGYRGFGKTIPGGGTAGTCNIDVICPVASLWANGVPNTIPATTPSVAVYSINGTGFCTGTMLNNPAGPLLNNPLRKQYFLSAFHCNVTSGNANTVVTYWNYESPACGTQGPDFVYDTQLQSIFRASDAATDFLLLELLNSPPANVRWAGWDATGSVPSSTVGIHHPSADVKSISFSPTAPQSAIWGGGLNASGNHWRVTWTSTGGVTEPGSSGSCIFDAATRRCIGQLHGGASFCFAPPQAMWDDYGKLSVSWNGGGTAATRLKDWLDPFNTGLMGMDGDPHISTLDGIHYDFQGAGEYVALRESDGTEIQTRTAPVSTTFNPGPDPYDGLATCVSVNTAVAAKVDGHRVTIQPNLSGFPDPSGLQVRVDGVLTPLGSNAVPVGAGRIVRSPIGNGYEINFPNGNAVYVTPLYWASQGKWYLNLDVFRNPGFGSGGFEEESDHEGAPEIGGLMAPLALGSWLPALPGGSSLGSMPSTLHQRYVDLYQKFGDSWRVGTDSLFDYAPGTSTATFTLSTWPPEHPPCVIPETPVASPLDPERAAMLCQGVVDKRLHANCVFDVTVTGEPGFAELFLATQRIRAGATFTTVAGRGEGEVATFVATVRPRGIGNEKPPAGTVQFLIDGEPAGDPVPLGPTGQAEWTTSGLKPGESRVAARYIALKDSLFLDSLSFDEIYTGDGDVKP